MKAILFGLSAVLATGALLVLCLPLGEQGALGWIALVPLLLVTRGRGFVPSFVASLGSLFFAAWLSSTGLLYGGHRGVNNDAWLYTGFGIFGFSFSLAFGLWGERGLGRFPTWWFAAWATLFEAILLLKLPAHLALSQYRSAAMVQLAAIGGIWLVSFLVWWANFALADALLMEGSVSQRLVRTRSVVAPVLAALLLSHAWLPATGPTRLFAALQIAEPEEALMRRVQAEVSLHNPSLVVWPEFGGMMLAPRGDTKILRGLGGAPFVTSFPDDAQPLPHNAAALFHDGKESIRYAKRKLFGSETNMHTAGTTAAAAGKVGLNVCFDSCFSSVIRDTARLGVEVVALPTIDPPSTNGFVAAVHAAFTPFRAAESGVAIVRADGYGHSMIVDARGRIVGEAPSGDATLLEKAHVGPRPTPARYFGDGWLGVCGIVVIYGIVSRRRRPPEKEEAATAPTTR